MRSSTSPVFLLLTSQKLRTPFLLAAIVFAGCVTTAVGASESFVVSSFVDTIPSNWSANWAWGVPLIVLTVVIHVLGLAFIKEKAFSVSSRTNRRRHHTAVSLMVIGGVILSATVLHAIEAGLWAVAYVLLNALTDYRSAMLYSLNAVTSYGHTDLELANHWHLMGALEALNGWLLFGLTTAFLFAVIEKIWIPQHT